jgi:hypothetical protein
LRHKPRLKPYVAVAHRAVDLGLWRQRRDRIDDDDIDGSRLNELLAYRERLFAARWLGDDESCEVDADLFRVAGIKRMLCIDERRCSARLLDVCDGMQASVVLPEDSWP